MQRALLQYSRPKNRKLAVKALRMAGRDDLIGDQPQALLPADSNRSGRKTGMKKQSQTSQRRPKHSRDNKRHAVNRKTKQSGHKQIEAGRGRTANNQRHY